MKIGLDFLPNEGGEAEGLSDAGIETFRDRPFAAVARETGQNSRDARDDANQPVVLRFDVIEVPAVEFPNLQEYLNAAQHCLDKSQSAEREKEIGFFRNAVSSLNGDSLKVLRIADFNTRGVRGPCVEGRPFHTLAKTDGLSVKEEASSGGSFGIGKNATFALSDIQTVFVSTLYYENDEEKVLCMGKTQFISHKDSNGKERRRKGYWGQIDDGYYMPLESMHHIPSWLKRDGQGTSIFSICLRQTTTDWRYEITAAILINFFCAIHRNEMEFEIDNALIKINKNTIEQLFGKQEVMDSVDQLNLQHEFEAARRLYQCLSDDQTTTQKIQVPELGNVCMHLLVRQGMNYTVGIVRNGMYITNNLSHFNEPFQRFPLYKDFSAVVEPAGVKESEWFKRLENPRHDTLSADRITDPDLREKGQNAFGKLAREIRERIKQATRTPPSDSVELEELNEFFVTDGNREEDELGSETDPRAKVANEISPSKKKPFTPNPPPGPGPEPGPNPGPGPGPGPGPSPNPQPNGGLQQIQLTKDRALILDQSKLAERRIIFTSPISAELRLFVDASGLNSEDRLILKKTSEGEISEKGLDIHCNAGERIKLDVEFDNAYAGPVEILAYQILKK